MCTHIYSGGPRLTMVGLRQFFDFTMVWKWYSFSRDYILNFEFFFFSWASDMWNDILSWCWAAAASCPRSALWSGSNNWYTHSHSAPRQSFCFRLSVWYSINCMNYSTLYYKIGFVLDDFAPLQAHVSVLSTFKEGGAQLWRSEGWLYSLLFNLMIFSTCNGFIRI